MSTNDNKEALRQSQSLHAGAVAAWFDGDSSYMSPEKKARLIEAGKAPGASIGEVTFGKIAEKHDIPLYAALQADAREKGEEFNAGYAQGVADVKKSPYYDDSCDTKPATQPAQASEAPIIVTDQMVERGMRPVYGDQPKDACGMRMRREIRAVLEAALSPQGDLIATSSQETASE